MMQLVYFIAVILFCIQVSCHKDIDPNDTCYGNFCWGDQNYPAEEIMDLLEKDNHLNESNPFGVYPTNIHQVPLWNESSCTLCKQLSKLRISPVTVRDDDDIFYVVRTENYRQNITLNICKSEEMQKRELAKCVTIGNSKETDGKKMACQQKSVMITLLVYDQKNSKFTYKTLQYPSACICAIVDTDYS